MNFEEEILVFKALSDSNRLKIIDMLSCSCNEMCACHMLESFDITQPTLSHHMRILIGADIVILRKQGSWNYYSINKEKIACINEFLKNIIVNRDKCYCDGKKLGKEEQNERD